MAQLFPVKRTMNLQSSWARFHSEGSERTRSNYADWYLIMLTDRAFPVQTGWTNVINVNSKTASYLWEKWALVAVFNELT